MTLDYVPLPKTFISAIWYHYRPEAAIDAGANNVSDWLDCIRIAFPMSFEGEGTFMAEKPQRHPMTTMPIVYRIPGMDAVTVKKNVAYRSTKDRALGMDIYAPPNASPGAKLPAVVFVTGYPDPGFESMMGSKLKDMEIYVTWARLIAASGHIAITYENTNPGEDVWVLLQHIKRNAATLGIDADRIALWSSSGNVPNALAVLMRIDSVHPIKCAVLCYGYMLDVEGSTAVADAARQWHFSNTAAGKTLADFPKNVPLFIARAGRDETPGLNTTLDRFITGALARDLPISLVNFAEAPHAFDMLHDHEGSREIIRQILTFLGFHLR